MNTINEVLKLVKEKVPYRKPIRYARSGDTWYVYTENQLNGGSKLEGVCDNGWVSVVGEKVTTVSPFDFPRGLKFIEL